jgi:hypothetical protein
MRDPENRPARTYHQTSKRRSRFDSEPAPQPLSATYSIDSEKRFVLVKFAKRLTFDDIEDYALDLRANPQFSPALSEIVDLRSVEEVELSPQQAMKLADGIDPFLLASKRAFVAQNQNQIVASHMHRILRPSGNIRVFFSIDEAKLWIVV